MADRSVVARDESYGSEARQASYFALTGKSYLVIDLVYFVSLSINVFKFVNATRTERNFPQQRECFFSFRL